MLDISQETQSRMNRVREAGTDTFSELVNIAELDPASDFRQANLQDVDFTGSDLSEFNFNFADLRGAVWDPAATSEPSHYKFALRGERRDPIFATDHAEIFERTLKARTWGERFFAFALAVDNFGEVNLTFDLLVQIVGEDSSVYMKFNSCLYFLASHLNHREATEYCRTMASASNSYSNMYRFKKLKRLLNELSCYAESITQAEKYPGNVPIEKIVSQSNLLLS